MSAKRLTTWTVATAVLLSLVSGSETVFAGPIGVVDNFNTAGLPQYTLTRVLDNGVATANVSFSDASGALVPSYTGTPNQPEQVVLLRNDFSLAAGEILTADVAQPTSTVEMDFGLAVSATATPNSVANPTPTDTRTTFDWLSVSVRPSQNSIRVNFSNAGTNNTSGTIINAVDETTVSKLFIQRLSANSFNVGYIDTSAVPHIANALPLTFGASNIGTAIGFYSDMRNGGVDGIGTSLGAIDNLRISVPEPTSWLLGMLSLVGIAPLWKRRARS